jgi:hypothetical protein
MMLNNEEEASGLHPGEKVPPRPESSTEELGFGDTDNVNYERKVTGFLWLAVLLSIISSTFLYALDNTVMANIRPGIVSSFGHMEMLQWISVAYPLGEVGSCPFW